MKIRYFGEVPLGSIKPWGTFTLQDGEAYDLARKLGQPDIRALQGQMFVVLPKDDKTPEEEFHCHMLNSDIDFVLSEVEVVTPVFT